MLTVIANSLMIATRAPRLERLNETARPANDQSARLRRSREIAAFLAAARHINA
ncbi:MAG: hypothetical protein Kow0026_03980 [Oricola sp.]